MQAFIVFTVPLTFAEGKINVMSAACDFTVRGRSLYSHLQLSHNATAIFSAFFGFKAFGAQPV